MKKEDLNKSRYCLQYDDHAKVISNVLCSMMEHQSLVDLAIRCGNNTIHVHKCVLAANSNYFKEQLEKNADTEQIVINGLDFAVVKALIEFMYCGETNILEENLKYLVAAAKFFQMRGIQSMAQDKSQFNLDDMSSIPAPSFLSKKPKYSNTYLPFNNPNVSNGIERSILQNDPSYHRRLKRKYMRTEAEKACAKEAAASRLALEALQKELANTSQVSSFVIEESCTETTVENFIPHTEDTYIDNLGQLTSVPLQVVNYSDINPSVLSSSSLIINPKNPVHYGLSNSEQEVRDPTTEKLKHILGTENLPNNVEIMFKTSEGNFVSVTEEVLANITRGSLQYQLVDENGHAGELQEVRVSEKLPIIDQSGQNSHDMGVPANNFVINQSSSNIIEKAQDDAPDPSIYIPTENTMNKSNKLSSITNDDYEGMIQECANQDEFPTEVFIKHTDIGAKKKLGSLSAKEPTFSTRQFEVFEEDTNSVYISNCDPLSEACGIAEKDESEKRKSEQNLLNANNHDGFGNMSENLLSASEIYDDVMKDNENLECKLPLKKFKLGKSFIELATDDSLRDSKPMDLSPRKTRSCRQLSLENNGDSDKENQSVNKYFETCIDKSKKLFPPRKKK